MMLLFARDGLLDHWQTLIGGLLTVLGTWIAAAAALFPVLRQLRLAQAANAVASFELLSRRFDELEKIRKETSCQLDRLLEDFSQGCLGFDGSLLDLNPEWAFEFQGQVRTLSEEMELQLRLSLVGPLINQARETVIKQLEWFADCLEEVHAPFSTDFYDPELNTARVDREAMLTRSVQAYDETVDWFSNIKKAAGDLDEAFLRSQVSIKEKLHLFEHTLLRQRDY